MICSHKLISPQRLITCTCSVTAVPLRERLAIQKVVLKAGNDRTRPLTRVKWNRAVRRDEQSRSCNSRSCSSVARVTEIYSSLWWNAASAAVRVGELTEPPQIRRDIKRGSEASGVIRNNLKLTKCRKENKWERRAERTEAGRASTEEGCTWKGHVLSHSGNGSQMFHRLKG